jgi:hypothetical protein
VSVNYLAETRLDVAICMMRERLQPGWEIASSAMHDFGIEGFAVTVNSIVAMLPNDDAFCVQAAASITEEEILSLRTQALIEQALWRKLREGPGPEVYP